MPRHLCSRAGRFAAAFFLVLLWGHLARAAEPSATIRNAIGMTFVRIPAGTFMMGSPADEPDRGAGETLHRVTLTKPFYMQTTEVTLGQWWKVMGRPFFFRRRGPADLPVTRVSWFDAKKFIEKLNTMGEGTYRLPTEAEWEYAARAGSTTAYAWGDLLDCSQAMFANDSEEVNTCQPYIAKHHLPLDGPAPVGSYAPNAWGLYDMHGNVWEWVEDWFAPYPTGPQIDPKGPASGTVRVRRGGSWFKYGYSCRSANRAYGHPASRLQTTGFRLVKVIAP